MDGLAAEIGEAQGRLDVVAHLRFLAEDVRNTELRLGATDWGDLSAAVWRQGDVDFTVPAMDFDLLLMCLGGEHAGHNVCEALGGREPVVYRRSALFFVPAGHPVRASFTGAVTHLHLMLAPSVIDGVMRTLRIPGLTRETLRGFHHRRDARLQALAGAARQAMATPGAATSLMADGLALAIAALLVENQGGGAPRSGAAAARNAPLAAAQLRRVMERIEAGLGETLRMGELAAECGLSPYAFSRAFRAATGAPPHRYVIERRIERAKAMLAAGAAPIAEVAYACGFASQAHLTTTFASRLGVTPGRYRAESRARR